MKTRIISIGLALAATFSPRPASATISSVIGWWHLGEGATQLSDSGGNTNNVSFRSQFTAGPNLPLIPPVTTTEAVGGPIGTNAFISTSALRFGLNASQSSFWNTTTNPPASNYACEIWFLPQNKGVVGGSVTWIFSTGGSDVNVPGSPWGGETVRLKDNFDGTSSLQAGMVFTNNSTGVIDFGPALLVDTNRWIHLALVNIGGTTVFYTNGVPVWTNDTGVSFPPAGAMFIGTDGDNQAIDGFVDEERLFTFAPGQFSTNDLLLRQLPSIIVQPAANTTVWNGGAVSFNTIASRDLANTFQWSKTGTGPLGGQINSTLYLPLVASADNASTYSCLVSNTTTGIAHTSSNATLSVVPVQTNNTDAYRSAVTGEPSLVAFFPMDGNTGGTINNTVDNSHNGTLELNAKYDGQTNRSFGERALSLNGDGDVQIPSNPAFEFGSGNGTVEALVYATTPTVPGYIVPGNITLFSVASADGSTVRYAIQASADGNTLIYTNDSPVQLSWGVPTSLLNRFAHVAIVFSGGTSVTAYVDGQSLGTKTQPGFGSATGVPAWIGSITTNVPGLWVGNIDELAVYSSALPANTIAIHNSKFLFGTNTSAPVIVSQSVSRTLYAGGSPVLSVTVAGTPPLSYVWKTNGVTVGTGSTLTLSNTTTNSSGTYVATISNALGSTNSQPINLSFVAPPIGYAAAVMNDHPSAYWRLDESSGSNMIDHAGGLDGTYLTTNFTLGAPGAIQGDPDTAVNFTGGNGEVPYSSILNPSGPFTVEFWAKPAANSTIYAPVSSQLRSGSTRSGFIIYQYNGGPGWTVQMGNGAGVQVQIIGAATVIPGNWYHVALTYDGGSNVTLYNYGYVDGAATNASGGNFVANASAPFEIGVRNGGAFPYAGEIDEVAFYNSALSQGQLQNHLGLGFPIKAAIVPSTNVVVDTKPAGTARDGLNNGAVWVASDSDGTTTRSGVMQFISTNNTQITDFGYPEFSTTNGTIMFWMRSAGTVTSGGNEGAILFDWRPSGGQGGVAFIQHDAGTFFVQSMNNYNHFDSVGLISDNKWHHCAVTFDQALGASVTLYIDGALDSSALNTSTWFPPTGQTVEIGSDTRYDGGYWRNYDGLMDDFRIYNRILTPTEIGQAMGGSVVDASALTLRFNFDASPKGYLVTWPYGSLQTAPVPNGSYGTITNLSSPLPIAPSDGPQNYFRVLR